MSDQPTDPDYRLPENFYRDLEDILRQHPAGLSEHNLLQALRSRGYFEFGQSRPAPPLELFQMHFLLLHGLYRLQQNGYEQQSALVDISPLRICLRSYRSGQNVLTKPDPLRDYYLDLGNLKMMSEEAVNDLLDAFWRDFVRFDSRASALAELGLQDPVDEATIKRTYRRLAMVHHPDRGGEAWRLQAINAAYRVLCKPV